MVKNNKLFCMCVSNITAMAQVTNRRVDLNSFKNENMKRLKTEPYFGITPNDLKF